MRSLAYAREPDVLYELYISLCHNNRGFLCYHRTHQQPIQTTNYRPYGEQSIVSAIQRITPDWQLQEVNIQLVLMAAVATQHQVLVLCMDDRSIGSSAL
jgi:hypothetical protein